MEKEKISYNELKQRCDIAIKSGWSMERLYMQLKSEQKIISRNRLRPLWIECGGKIREVRRCY